MIQQSLPPTPSQHVASTITFQAEGQTWTLSPLRIIDLRELEQHLRDSKWAEVRRQVASMPEAAQQAIASRAYEEIEAIKIGTRRFDEEAQSLTGMMFMFWLCLRRNHPELTFEETQLLVTEENVQEVTRAVNQMAGFRQEGGRHPTKAGRRK